MSKAAVLKELVRRSRYRMLAFAALALTSAAGAWAGNPAIHTDPLNFDPVVKDAYKHFYDLDYEGALSRFEQVRAAHSHNAIATDYVLNCILFRELYRQDLLDTTFYANDGFLTGKHTIAEDPKVREQIERLSNDAMGQADDVLRNKPDDVNALFARGWARSLRAAYEGMVERSFISALRMAVDAKNDHQRVLDLDPQYADAKMVVGVYQFVIGSLGFGFKMVVGVAGISGSKSKGLELLQSSAAYGVITSNESKTCIALFLRRERRYKEAIEIVRGQAQAYPRDFLFALEEANLLKDDGQGDAAIAAYQRLLNNARTPGHYPNAHLELAYFGLGDTLRGRNRYGEAVTAFQQAAVQSTISSELKRRCLLAAGEVYDLMHDHDKAKGEYLAVVAAGPDTSQADLARKYMRSAYNP
jgi:tetratricopeptide (TPR) repeat protein